MGGDEVGVLGRVHIVCRYEGRRREGMLDLGVEI